LFERKDWNDINFKNNRAKRRKIENKSFCKKIQRRRFFLSSFTTKMFNLSKRNERLAL
jgi:hypothetical protein